MKRSKPKIEPTVHVNKGITYSTFAPEANKKTRGYKCEIAAMNETDATRISNLSKAAVSAAKFAVETIGKHFFDTIDIRLKDGRYEKFYIWDLYDLRNQALNECKNNFDVVMSDGHIIGKTRGKECHVAKIRGKDIEIPVTHLRQGAYLSYYLLSPSGYYRTLFGATTNDVESVLRKSYAVLAGIDPGEMQFCASTFVSGAIVNTMVNGKLRSFVGAKMLRNVGEGYDDKLFRNSIKLSLGWNGNDPERKFDNWKHMPENVQMLAAQLEQVGPDTHSYLNKRMPSLAIWDKKSKNGEDAFPYAKVCGKKVKIEKPTDIEKFNKAYCAAMRVFIENMGCVKLSDNTAVPVDHCIVNLDVHKDGYYNSELVIPQLPVSGNERASATLLMKTRSQSRVGKFPYFAGIEKALKETPTVTVSLPKSAFMPEDIISPSGFRKCPRHAEFTGSVAGSVESTEIKISDETKMDKESVVGIDLNTAVFFYNTSIPVNLMGDVVDWVGELAEYYEKFHDNGIIEKELARTTMCRREIDAVIGELEAMYRAVHERPKKDSVHCYAFMLTLGIRYGLVGIRENGWKTPVDPLVGFFAYLRRKYHSGTRKREIVDYTFIQRRLIKEQIVGYERYYAKQSEWSLKHTGKFSETVEAAALLNERHAIDNRIDSNMARIRSICFLDTEFGKKRLKVIKMENDLNFNGEKDRKVKSLFRVITKGWFEGADFIPDITFSPDGYSADVTFPCPKGHTAKTIKNAADRCSDLWVCDKVYVRNGAVKMKCSATREFIELRAITRADGRLIKSLHISIEGKAMEKMCAKRKILFGTVDKRGTSFTDHYTMVGLPKTVTKSKVRTAGIEGCRMNGWNYRSGRTFITFVPESPWYGMYQYADENSACCVKNQKFMFR